MKYLDRFCYMRLLTTGIVLFLSAAGAMAQEASQNPLNKKPLTVWGNTLNEKIRTKEVDLDAPFMVKVGADLDRAGRFDPKNMKVLREEGNASSAEAIRQLILALNESGFFSYISNFGSKTVTVCIKQDAVNFGMEFSLDATTQTRARTIASGMRMYVAIGKSQRELRENERLVLENITITDVDKRISASLNIPKATFRGIIETELARVK